MQGKRCKMSVYIIAEAGVNHNGDIHIAKKLADEAKQAGADCIKFQTFKAENLVSSSAKKADYQISNTGNNESQYRMLKKLELSYDEFSELKQYCELIGIEFLSTPFDFNSIDFLNDLVKIWKIPSGEITNLPYLIKIAKTGKPVILSTGMSTLEEVKESYKILSINGAREISLLHCTTEYPAPYSEVNLRVLETLREKFNCPVGYSDHTKGIEVSIAAVALGATIIEKHFTLDNNMEGPDHKASLEPQELTQMVQSIRNVEKSLGSKDKIPSTSEFKNLPIARKSIVAKIDIKKGELFSDKNIIPKRPGDGISPMNWFSVIGQVARRDFVEDEQIEI